MGIKKGQVTILGLMLFTMVIIFAIMIIPFLQTNITEVRGTTGLNCSNEANLTTGGSMTCIAVDLILPYFIGAIILVGGGVVAYKYGTAG